MARADLDRAVDCYPVLQQLPESLMRRIADEAVLVEAPADRPLFHEDSPCQHFPLLIDGVIRACKASPEGHEILLYRLRPGESCVITVVALLGGTTYPAAASAEQDVRLLGIPRELFIELVLQSAPFRLFVFRFLSERMAHLMALIDDVAFRRVDQRLASRLLRHDKPLEVTHQMLADDLGTTREVVSRILKAFQDAGILRLGRKRIEILDRGALDRIYRTDAGRAAASGLSVTKKSAPQSRLTR